MSFFFDTHGGTYTESWRPSRTFVLCLFLLSHIYWLCGFVQHLFLLWCRQTVRPPRSVPLIGGRSSAVMFSVRSCCCFLNCSIRVCSFSVHLTPWRIFAFFKPNAVEMPEWRNSRRKLRVLLLLPRWPVQHRWCHFVETTLYASKVNSLYFPFAPCTFNCSRYYIFVIFILRPL